MVSRAYITKEVLQWARADRMGLAVEALAQKMGQTPVKIKSWENGSAKPTIRQAQKLAKELKIPFGYLFLSEPPTEPAPIADYRRVPGADPAKPSPDLLELIQNVQLKQQRYREIIEPDGHRVPVAGRFNHNTAPPDVANYLRELLTISELQRRAKNYEDFFWKAIRRCESVGILVMRSGCVGNASRTRKLRVAEFRGFAINDPIAPVVFVNTQDSKAAQIFTLLHEVAHIAIGATGLSDHHAGKVNFYNDVERLCDAVAAETLVPTSDFDLAWSLSLSIDDNLEMLRKRFKVGLLVVLRRAYDTGRLSRDEFFDEFEKASDRIKNWEKMQFERDEETIIGFNSVMVPMRNSRTVTTALVGAALEGRLPYSEVGHLLNVRPAGVRDIASAIGLTDGC